MELFQNMTAGAEFSPCMKYRYKLWRIWDPARPMAMCIGLNPSTANELKADPTITNLTKMLRILDFGGFYMTNLFAWVSSDPDDLLKCEDPVADNDWFLDDVKCRCDTVIICWGNFSQAENRIQEVLPRIPHPRCFGINKNGTPSHPLAMMYQGKTNAPILMEYIYELTTLRG